MFWIGLATGIVVAVPVTWFLVRRYFIVTVLKAMVSGFSGVKK